MKPKYVVKPWGVYVDYFRTDSYVVKELMVDPRSKLSLQTHARRSEYWFCLEGKGVAQVGGVKIPLVKGTAVVVPRNTMHRIINNSDRLLRILEVQEGACSEADIIRYQDDYGRQ